ncbi:MAG: hypothetical protein Q4D39_02210 [Coriobacteriaceae bacterium]|nr:hypothetical protein [Coriobacteriaceae bacterium]
MTETKVYVGLNDAFTLEQRFETEKYTSILKKVCYSYHVPFSFSEIEGGYFHENGDFTQERTLALSFFDIDGDTVEEIARDLCVFFRQESVLVVESDVTIRFIKESL